jgi:hypothetical protein
MTNRLRTEGTRNLASASVHAGVEKIHRAELCRLAVCASRHHAEDRGRRPRPFAPTSAEGHPRCDRDPRAYRGSRAGIYGNCSTIWPALWTAQLHRL